MNVMIIRYEFGCPPEQNNEFGVVFLTLDPSMLPRNDLRLSLCDIADRFACLFFPWNRKMESHHRAPGDFPVMILFAAFEIRTVPNVIR